MIYLLLGTGFEEIEAVTPLDLMRRAGIPAATVGVNGKTVVGSHGIPVVADLTLEELDLTQMEGIVLPGGLKGVASLRESKAAMEAIRFAWENQLLTAAICAGPTVLADLGIPDGKNAVCYPGCEGQMGNANLLPLASATDGKLVTGASAGCAVSFGLALVAALRGDAAAKTVAEQIVIR